MRDLAQVTKSSEQRLIRTCSIWRALEVVGDTSTLLVLEAIWWGARRFDQIQVRSGLQKALVSDRLKKMMEADILFKRPYMEKPPRFEYLLTKKGQDLYWTSLMLLRWERKWSSQRSRLKTELTHKSCGEVINPEPLCEHCRQIVHPTDVSWEEGPGVGLMAPLYSRRRQRRSSGEGEREQASIFTEAAELMGDRWSSLILRSVFTHLRKFDEIMKDTAIASNILSERLAWLTDIGVLTTVLYQTNPDRFEYWLTKKGLDYYPILVMLQQWGDKYYASPEGPPVILFHKTCGHALHPYVGCSSCAEALIPAEVDFKILTRRPARSNSQ